MKLIKKELNEYYSNDIWFQDVDNEHKLVGKYIDTYTSGVIKVKGYLKNNIMLGKVTFFNQKRNKYENLFVL